MTKVRVRVHGQARLDATLAAAGKQVGDLRSAYGKVGQTIARAAAGAAPRRSGALAASGRSEGLPSLALVEFGSAAVPYAGVVHWGWPDRHIPADPFASNAAVASEPVWLGHVAEALQDTLDTVKGA